MKRHSWKYIAGLFDGEGCIDTQRAYNRAYPGSLYVRPRVRIGMAISAEGLIKELQANFGGHIGYRASTKAEWQSSLTWEMLNQKDMEHFLGNTVDHLVLKREQAKLALWWLGNYSGLQSRAVGAWIETARHLFASELKAMKLDPQRLSDRAVQQLIKLRTDAIV